MQLRKVQKTKDMFYLYLPKSWCRQYHVQGQSTVSVQTNQDGSLAVYPQAPKHEPTHITFYSDAITENVQKLLVACYMSPADSFSITIQGNHQTAINQKNLLSLEAVEVEGNQITCESSVPVRDVRSLLLTMIKKVKNLLVLLQENQLQLVDRYEDEVDRSKLLIEKSVIAALHNPTQAAHTPVELHFMALLSRELEHLVDHIIVLEPNKEFLKQVHKSLAQVQKLLTPHLRYEHIQEFLGMVNAVQGVQVHDLSSYNKHRVTRALNRIAEILIDWSVLLAVTYK